MPRIMRALCSQAPATAAFFIFFFLFLLLFLFPPSHAHANALLMQTEDERVVRWDLSADKVITFNDSEIMEAHGNVHFKRGNEYLKADFARYYMSTKWVYLQGNVKVFTSGKDELSADEAEFDLRSRTGWMKNGNIFMAGPHAYISGDRIDKHWGDVYSFSQAKITVCDGDVPAWSFTSDEAVVEVDGYARLSGSSFQIKDTPVLYTPFFIFPVKTTRQTGLLTPEYGRSTRKGLYLNIPFFWAIDQSSDLTINEYYMEKRGFMHGIEYRTRPTSDTAGWIRADYLRDSKVERYDDGAYAGDGYIRNNRDRYWIRGMFDTRLPDPQWRFKADLDFVSDQYFLSEFSDGFSGYSRSRDELASLFKRELQEKDRHRVSGFLLNRDWERASISLSSLYKQNQYLGNGNLDRELDETVQQLPTIDAFLHKGRILPNFPLEIDATAQAGYYYRRHGTRGARYEVVPRLTLPFNTRYGSIIASGGLYQTFYETERSSRMADSSRSDYSKQTGENRTLPEFNVAGFTEFARVYPMSSSPLKLSSESVGENRWLGLRHSVQPRLEYRFRSNEEQEDNPHYISDDRLSATSEITYSITNVFTVKKEKVTVAKADDGQMVPSLTTYYHDLVRFRLQQAYDVREADRSDDRDEYERRPFGDIFADIVISPTENVSLTTRNDWSPYLKDFTRHQSGIGVSSQTFGYAYVGYDIRKALDEYKRERDDKVRYLRFDYISPQVGPFSLALSLKHDYKNLDNKEADVDLIYNHQCFKLIGRMSVDPQEENYQVMVMLTGLGD